MNDDDTASLVTALCPPGNKASTASWESLNLRAGRNLSGYFLVTQIGKAQPQEAEIAQVL